VIVPNGTKPEFGLYYLGACLLSLLTRETHKKHDVVSLYETMKSSHIGYSFRQHLLALNWLFLLNTLDANEEGDLILCLSST
jgi:hypothetical protein